MERDRAPREAALKHVERALQRRWLRGRDEDDELLAHFLSARRVLASNEEDLEEDEVAALASLASALKEDAVTAGLSRLTDELERARANEAKENP